MSTKISHKDFSGRPLEVGDTVAYIDGRRGNQSLYKGKVIGETPTKVRLDTGVKLSKKLAKIDE